MAEIETLTSGYGLVEGPRVDADDCLYFSDVLKGGVYRRTTDGAIETVIPKRRGVGGIALHADGGVVVSGRNICHVKDGVTRILFEREDVPGWNDLITDSQGRVITGSMRSSPFDSEGGPRQTGEAYRVDTAGEATQLYDDISLTNGIGFSPDGRRIYHSDTARGHVVVHTVNEDGSCGERAVLAETPRGAPDGLAVDEDGAVWVACYGGGCATRLSPTGEVLGHVEVPALNVTSLCFGGADRRDLYVVSADNTDDAQLGGSIFRTRVATPGVAIPYAQL